MRRVRALCAAAALTVLAITPATQAAGASSRRHCPAAESLVPHTTWHRQALAPGVRLSEGDKKDSRGVVAMHVLRVRLGTRHLKVAPLLGDLTRRVPLSRLAAGHKHLVAAINTGYFNFGTGAPTGPLIVGGRALVLSDRHQKVIGLTAAQHAQSGRVWLSATAKAAHGQVAITSINELRPPIGLSIYTHRWGRREISFRGGAARRISSAGTTSSISRYRYVPSRGYLLVARGSKAQHQLTAIGTGSAITVTTKVRTSTSRPFSQAYGVGSELVAHRGKARSGFSCHNANTTQPARTAIGYTRHGHTLVMAVVSEHPHTSLHGLDNTQMSKLMEQLGVSRAFDFDGSGSSELLAKLPGSHRLSLRNYPADGAERPMPLGLGIY